MGTLFFSKRKKKFNETTRTSLITLMVIFFSFFVVTVSAQSRRNITDFVHDRRGEPDLTVCSQNLANLGNFADTARRIKGMNQEKYEEKRKAIVKRFVELKCDIIAVQELLGAKEARSKDVLEDIAELIRFRTNRKYKVFVGPTNDKFSRVGYLYDEDRLTFNGLTSYVAVELPKITQTQKPRLFVRGPLELRLKLKGDKKSPSRDIILINFHFKSKVFNSRDGANLEWETYRMEMAEALRRIVEARHKEAVEGDGTLLIVLGDRNSHYDSASAKILTGELKLTSFQGEGACRLSKRGIPLCQEGATQIPLFYSVLTNDPQTFQTPGTFLYENTYSWLDDILLPASNLPFAFTKPGIEGDYDSGTYTLLEEASDHALVWVRFNW